MLHSKSQLQKRIHTRRHTHTLLHNAAAQQNIKRRHCDTQTQTNTRTHTRGNEEALHKQTKTSDERQTLHTSHFVIACAAEKDSSHCRSLPIISFPKIWEIISSLLAFGHHTADSGFSNFSRLPQLIIATHTYTHTHILTHTHTLLHKAAPQHPRRTYKR